MMMTGFELVTFEITNFMPHCSINRIIYKTDKQFFTALMYGNQNELMHVSIGKHAATDYCRRICGRVIKNYPDDPGPFVERVELTLWDRGPRDNALIHRARA